MTNSESENSGSNRYSKVMESFEVAFWITLFHIVLLLPLAFGLGVIDDIEQEEHSANVTIQDDEVLNSVTQTKYGIIINFTNKFEYQTVVEVTNKDGTVVGKMLLGQSDSISFTPKSDLDSLERPIMYHVKFIDVETNKVKHSDTVYIK